MKLVRTIGLVLGGILGVAVIAAVLFVMFFPKDLAAREAERRIEEATGRELTLGQDIELSFWPALGFSVDQAALSNPEGFSTEQPFLTADRIVFAVKLLPLLRGAIEVKELTLEGAEVRLVARPDGAVNWAFPTEANAPQEQTTLEDLRLDDVRLTDCTISLQPADGGEALVLEDFDASLSLQSLDTPARFTAAFGYRGERLSVAGAIGLPRAVLERGETPLNAQVRSAPLNASFEGGFNAVDGGLDGVLQANGPSLRRMLAWMGSPMGEGGGFAAFRLEAQLAHRQQQTSLREAEIQLDAVEARGDLTLVHQESGKLRIEGALAAPSVDLNTYLPAPAQGTQGGVEVDTAWPTTPLDLSGLRALDANLNLTLGALKFQRMSFADVALNLRVANGAADARLTRISLYEGSGTARLIADGSRSTPRIAVEISAENIQGEPLLRDAVGFDRIAGRGRLSAALVGQGATQAALMRSWRGNASFQFNDGQWKGVNLAQVARTVQAALSGQAAGEGATTDFAELAASFAVADGVAATDNLRLLNPFVRLEGRGLINIGAQTIDMRIAPRAVNSAQGQGGDLTAAGLGVPFRISGPWSNVSFRPALEDVVQDQLRNILNQQDQGSPLASLGAALFGRQAPAPAPGGAQPPAGSSPAPAATPPAAQPSTEERARNALQDALRNAVGGDREKQTPPPGP